MRSLTAHRFRDWVLAGTITGESTTHDVKVEWVLNHQWVRIHETSREKTPSGEPQYEASVYIGWHGERKEYVVHWIDVFGGAFADVGYAKREGDSLPFVFQDDDGTFHTTFSFDRATVTWKWAMDSVSKGQSMDQGKPFARLTMTRREGEKGPRISSGRVGLGTRRICQRSVLGRARPPAAHQSAKGRCRYAASSPSCLRTTPAVSSACHVALRLIESATSRSPIRAALRADSAQLNGLDGLKLVRSETSANAWR